MAELLSKSRIRIKYLCYLVVLLGIAVRCYKFGLVPSNLQADEAGAAYDAWSLVNYGVDRFRISFPVYFINFGGGQNALYTYLCAIAISIFGFSQAAVRLPALVISGIMALCGVSIVRNTWKDRCGISDDYAGLAFAFLYAVAPYTYMVSRFGLESDLFFGISTIFMLFLIKAVNENKWYLYTLAGFFAGMVLYTYAISYFIMIAFLLIILVYLLIIKKIKIKNVLSLALPLGILACPLILEQLVNMLDKSEKHVGIFTITKLFTYRSSELTFSNIFSNFLLTIKSFLFYDWLDYNTIPRFLTFYYISIPFFFIGAFWALKETVLAIKTRKWTPTVAVTIWFYLQLLMGCLLGENGNKYTNPNSNKINGIFFPVMMFIVYGFLYCLSYLKRINARRIFSIGVAAIYICFFALFLNYYFNEYEPKENMYSEYTQICDYIASDEGLAGKQTFTDTSYIYYLLSVMPSPYDVDVANQDFGMYTTDIDDMTETLESYGCGANYIMFEPTEDIINLMETHDLSSMEFGQYTLFYSK